MGMNVATGIGAHSGVPADGRLDKGLVEPHPHGRQAIDMGRVQGLVTIATEIIPAELIEHDEQDVLCFGQGSVS